MQGNSLRYNTVFLGLDGLGYWGNLQLDIGYWLWILDISFWIFARDIGFDYHTKMQCEQPLSNFLQAYLTRLITNTSAF